MRDDVPGTIHDSTACSLWGLKLLYPPILLLKDVFWMEEVVSRQEAVEDPGILLRLPTNTMSAINAV